MNIGDAVLDSECRSINSSKDRIKRISERLFGKEDRKSSGLLCEITELQEKKNQYFAKVREGTEKLGTLDVAFRNTQRGHPQYAARQRRLREVEHAKQSNYIEFKRCQKEVVDLLNEKDQLEIEKTQCRRNIIKSYDIMVTYKLDDPSQ